MKEIPMRVLNLGAGVQSTTLALMAKTGEVEPYDYAIFADTQAEPKSVYHHLKWLIREVSFPVMVRTRGNLAENLISGVDADGGRYISIPAFTGEPGKAIGIIRRQCTSEYKIKVVERAIRREILGLEPGQRIPKSVSIVQSFGLSADEPGRVVRVKANHTAKAWAVEFPLYDMEMTRADCVRWLEDYGVPHVVPRSACTFCPYHSNVEWKRLKAEEPEAFNQAVEADRSIRDKASRCTHGMRDMLWIHRSCKPLDEIDFDANPKDLPGQRVFGFESECEGMCGV
jgi:hypothetical protein